MNLYNSAPQIIKTIPLQVHEYFSYHYYPIKLKGQSKTVYEERLKVFEPLIGTICCDFVGKDGLDKFVDSYVYITAKHQYQRENIGFNREGWHTDGFGSDDITYIWSNKQPTIYNKTEFDLSEDDILSMKEMDEQVDPSLNYSLPNNTLVRLDQFVVHKVGEFLEGNRCFLKIVFSKDIFNLEGNSVNYLLPYIWDYKPRKKERNIPYEHIRNNRRLST